MGVQFTDHFVRDFTAGEDLLKYRLVKPGPAATLEEVVYADANDVPIGATRAIAVDGDPIGITLLSKYGTMILVASGAITAGALVYAAEDGKVSADGVNLVGRALTATNADGDQLEVLPILLLDPFVNTADVFEVFEDFTDLLLTGAERQWTGTLTDTGTLAIQDAVGGEVKTEASDGSVGDNDEAYLGMTNECFLLAAGKPIVFEARVKIGTADTGNVYNVIAGLMSAPNAANTLQDNGAGPPANYDGAVFYKVDGDTAWLAEVSVGATQTAVTLTAPGRPQQTYQVLRIELIPTSSTAAIARFYVDGVLVGTSASFTYTGITEMAPVVGTKNGDATINTTLHTDYIRVRQAR